MYSSDTLSTCTPKTSLYKLYTIKNSQKQLKTIKNVNIDQNLPNTV